MTAGKRLEAEVRELLDTSFPACTLSGVCMFQPDQFVKGRNFGSEIDHLVHIQTDDADHLLLFECKAQEIQFRGSAANDAAKEWVVIYSQGGETKAKHIKSQLFAQTQALLQNLYPRERSLPVHVHAFAISNAPATPQLHYRQASDQNLTYHLVSIQALRALLANDPEFSDKIGLPSKRWRPLRIQQSDILRKVRHGLVLPELGHPEVPNGMRYVARCREILDCELTNYFRPTTEGRWVINGGAGMGKTVLLAYTATVFGCGYVIEEKRADRQLPKREVAPWVTRRTARSSFAAMRKASARRLSARSRACPWASAISAPPSLNNPEAGRLMSFDF